MRQAHHRLRGLGCVELEAGKLLLRMLSNAVWPAPSLCISAPLQLEFYLYQVTSHLCH
jgi:hypothetical protein